MTVERTQRVVRQADKIDESWIMSDSEFAALGDGEVAYIKSLSSEEAQAAYPSIDDLPEGLSLFALHAADGTPIALTDDMGTAIEHAMGDELEIAPLH
jgi:hypothetical protein